MSHGESCQLYFPIFALYLLSSSLVHLLRNVGPSGRAQGVDVCKLCHQGKNLYANSGKTCATVRPREQLERCFGCRGQWCGQCQSTWTPANASTRKHPQNIGRLDKTKKPSSARQPLNIVAIFLPLSNLTSSFTIVSDQSKLFIRFGFLRTFHQIYELIPKEHQHSPIIRKCHFSPAIEILLSSCIQD